MASASATYKARANEARKLILKLSGKIRKHEKEQAKDPNNWGYAGDMGHVVESLKVINRFLGSGG